jgi:hypothetical protein
MQPSKEFRDTRVWTKAYMVSTIFTKPPCIFMVRWHVTSQKLANRSFPGFLRKVKKIMLTFFSLFLKKMKVYGLHGLTSSFFANLWKTFQNWTFYKCPKTGYGAPSIKYPKMTFLCLNRLQNVWAYMVTGFQKSWKLGRACFQTFLKYCFLINWRVHENDFIPKHLKLKPWI